MLALGDTAVRCSRSASAAPGCPAEGRTARPLELRAAAAVPVGPQVMPRRHLMGGIRRYGWLFALVVVVALVAPGRPGRLRARRSSAGGLRVPSRRVRRAERAPAASLLGIARDTGSSTARTWTRRPACRWTTSPSREVRPPPPVTGGTPPRPTSGCTCGPWCRPGPRPDQRVAGPRQAHGHPDRGVAPEAVRRLPVSVVRHHQRCRADQSGQGDCTETTPAFDNCFFVSNVDNGWYASGLIVVRRPCPGWSGLVNA